MPRPNRNGEFAKWWADWISRIQRNRAIEKQGHHKRDMIGGKQERPTEKDSEGMNSHFPCSRDGSPD